MSRRVRRGAGGAYGRFLLAVVICGALLLAAGGIALVLRGRAPEPGESVAVSSADPGDAQAVALGRQVYDQACAVCHGLTLAGQSGWQEGPPGGPAPAPPLDGSGRSWQRPDQMLFDITKFGGQPYAPQGYTSAMPAFEGTLSDSEIWAALAYIKSTWPPEARAAQP